MIIANHFKEKFFLIFFLIFISIFQFYSFQNIIPHHDQTFHINWLLNLKNTDHFLSSKFFINPKNLMYDENGFIYELLKPANNTSDYHAYLFQINSILVVYIFSIFLEIEPIKIYIFVSILFSSLSIIINYQILITILKDYNIYKNSNNFIYQFIFCLLNISFYKHFFSPLGHHNISYFFFSVTILILLNRSFNNSKKFPYFMGLILGFVSYFQITIVLLLLPFISLFFLFYDFRISKNNFKRFSKFFLTCFVFYIPFIFLIINDLLTSNKNFFDNLIGGNTLGAEFYFKKIFFWFKKFYQFGFPIIFFGFFCSIIVSFKLKKNNYIQYIILIHFIINVFLSIFYISYLRNFYYVFNIFIILSSFSLIYFFQKNNLFRLITILLVSFSFIYNSKIILNDKKLESVEPLFFQLYFEDKGNLKNKIQKIISLNKNNLIFFSDFSKNYFKAHEFDFVKNNFLTTKPLLNLSRHLDAKNNSYSKNTLKKFGILDKDFHLISFTQDFNLTSSIIYKLQNSNLIDKKCRIQLPHLINEPIFRDSGSGNFNINIYLTKMVC
jgi:hypothetical protein